jgi:Cof subfamily protein (haloacid dehalogenase superfamily)
VELIVFDLDGTLLNKQSEISSYSHDTLSALTERGIAYTVATGRTLHGAVDVLQGHNFLLPQIFKNGVMIWNPEQQDYSLRNFLTLDEISHVLEAILTQGVTPFLFTLEPGNRHAIYHPPLQTAVEKKLAADFSRRMEVEVLPVAELPADADITNISAMGLPEAVIAIEMLIESEPQLVAYAGAALEDKSLKWIDIHHSNASKGGAVDLLRVQLGASKVLCFGDSDNDLSMFATADECYAPENAKEEVKAAATEVIGHHDEDGIARFLRRRFDIPEG